jgi:hypothetical protein
MAKTALALLQEQIEAIRREAYAEGYSAAMQAVRQLASRPSGRSAEAAAAQPAPRRLRSAAKRAAAGKPAEQQPRRGDNARMVEEMLRSIAPRAARPTDIRNALRRERGIAMAFTSIRHALNQLEGRQSIERVADSKTWRYRPQGGGAAKSG